MCAPRCQCPRWSRWMARMPFRTAVFSAGQETRGGGHGHLQPRGGSAPRRVPGHQAQQEVEGAAGGGAGGGGGCEGCGQGEGCGDGAEYGGESDQDAWQAAGVAERGGEHKGEGAGRDDRGERGADAGAVLGGHDGAGSSWWAGGSGTSEPEAALFGRRYFSGL